MDTWNERQLKLMSLGGNKNLGEFFQIYELIDESVQSRYKTKAAEFYRQKVFMSMTLILILVEGTS
jgi:hypothetical protein